MNKKTVLFMIFTLIILFIVLLTVIPMNFAKPYKEETGEDRQFHIIVTGTYEDQAIVKEIYNGVNESSSFYDSYTELYIPDSLIENKTTNEQLRYASYIKADAVICYIPMNETNVITPTYDDGRVIPLITVGKNLPGLIKNGHIEINIEKLSTLITTQIKELYNNEKIVIISRKKSLEEREDMLLNTISLSLRLNNMKNYIFLNKDSVTNESRLTELIKDNNEKLFFVCLSDEVSLNTCSLLTKSNYLDTKLICIGSATLLESYVKNGLISELISINYNSIGSGCLELLTNAKKGVKSKANLLDLSVTINKGTQYETQVLSQQ